MGAWGWSAFENDAAADWLAEGPASNRAGHVESALQAALPSPLALLRQQRGSSASVPLDAGTACIALAAAEVVAAKCGNPHPAWTAGLSRWLVEEGGDWGPALADLARLVVDQVESDSELRDLWREGDDYPAWQAELEALRERFAR